jgi:hypothetical protein
MKERPILFSAPMVRAILEGRKTQTRRVMNPQPLFVSGGVPFRPLPPRLVGVADPKAGVLYLPRYGVRGDRLWVRESGWIAKSGLAFIPSEGNGPPPGGFVSPSGEPYKRCPSIHMPRWATRITLEVTGVRVERLQDISEADADDEGGAYHDGRGVGHSGWRHDPSHGVVYATARESFSALWQSINGAESWVANPWIWVVEFKRVTP